jgi:hypothetical protein
VIGYYFSDDVKIFSLLLLIQNLATMGFNFFLILIDGYDIQYQTTPLVVMVIVCLWTAKTFFYENQRPPKVK